MKYTFNLDKELLDHAMRACGAKTKTETITYALKEVARRDRLTELLRKGTGATPDELKSMYITPEEILASQVAENSASYPEQDVS